MSQTPSHERLALLQLNLVSGIGPRLQTLLLNRFDTAEGVFAASGPELLSVEGVGPKLSAAITAGRNFEEAHAEWERCSTAGLTLFFRDDDNYPASLKEIHDAPPVLYCRGKLEECDQLAIGMVGSRQCTVYGRAIAEKLAAGLCRAGITVISGLARGIDAAAHQGALRAGGRTLAVCATGLGNIYPPEHDTLAGEIAQQGALLSESPVLRGPNRGLFPQRNRIISGLSLGVVIVEAGRKSGALHTARHAMEQGREVFAVPGRIDTPSSMGCLDLIRDGVTLVRGVDDILDALGPLINPVRTGPETVVHAPRELNLNEQEAEVLNLIDTVPTPIDHVLAGTPIDSSRVLSTLTVLEMKRLISRVPGGCVVRTGR
ncbi:MAG: DNA-processing protein DprA [Planctomycetaceae bacterium]|nr:DNA-processing protein DprA [Planctomycetaceae bacterium]